MSAGKYEMVCEQGATLRRVLTWKDSGGSPINLTGYSAAMQVRRSATDTGTPLFTAAGGTLTLGGVAGTITILLTAVQTAALPSGRYVYDLELTAPNGDVTRLIEGVFSVRPEVTR